MNNSDEDASGAHFVNLTYCLWLPAGKDEFGFDLFDDAPLSRTALYRRQVAFRMQKAADIFDGSFADYLAGQRSDTYVTLEDFLVHKIESAQQHTLDELLDGRKLILDPDEVVFKEAESRLVDKKGRLLVEF